MLLTFIILYMGITLLTGYFASRLVKNVKDFAVAGRRLPLLISASAFFATWFGAETVLGASSEFAIHGLSGVIEDPFGASLCLFLIALFFAKPLYRLNMITIGDFYRHRYGRTVELISGIFMIISYFSWIAAQFIAFGLILNIVSGLDVKTGIIIGTVTVVCYTCMGGMWSISITDFIQTVVIVAGMLLVSFSLTDQAGGLTKVIRQAPSGFFNILPRKDPNAILEHIAAWITIGLGSIPSQDIFQRITAARSGKVAVQSAMTGGIMYLTIAFIPLLIVLCIKVLHPSERLPDQNYMLEIILGHTNLFIQVMFFGALLSAIMSTASAAVLAPATILGENILKPRFPGMSDKNLLFSLRVFVILIAAVSLLITIFEDNIYHLVGESSVITLISLFIPLVFGVYSKKANTEGALLSIFAGLLAWYFSESLFGKNIPPVISGLSASFAGMLAGIIFGRKASLRLLRIRTKLFGTK
jgi:solute:Na+ symporter, SSS family